MIVYCERIVLYVSIVSSQLVHLEFICFIIIIVFFLAKEPFIKDICGYEGGDLSCADICRHG